MQENEIEVSKLFQDNKRFSTEPFTLDGLEPTIIREGGSLKRSYKNRIEVGNILRSRLRRYVLCYKVKTRRFAEAFRSREWIKDTVEWDLNKKQDQYQDWPWLDEAEKQSIENVLQIVERYKKKTDSKEKVRKQANAPQYLLGTLDLLFYKCLDTQLAESEKCLGVALHLEDLLHIFERTQDISYGLVEAYATFSSAWDGLSQISALHSNKMDTLHERVQSQCHELSTNSGLPKDFFNNELRELDLSLHQVQRALWQLRSRLWDLYGDDRLSDVGIPFTPQARLAALGMNDPWPALENKRYPFEVFLPARRTQSELFSWLVGLGVPKIRSSEAIDLLFVSLFSKQGWYHDTPNPKRIKNRFEKRRSRKSRNNTN